MDIYATKGIEYLLVIGYLLVLVPFWWLLQRASLRRAPAAAPARRSPAAARPWFTLPDGFHFHRGHAWARPEAGGVFRVGMDDFAQRLIGRPEALRLPHAGQRLEQGEAGWRLEADGHGLDVLSPVAGEVVEVNEDAVRAPELICEEPYGRGWLLKVKAPRASAVLANLLPAKLARDWTQEAARRLDALMSPQLGAVLQDGGLPVSGFARQLAGERWHELAAELLLTAEGEDRDVTS